MIFQESELRFDFSDEHWSCIVKFDETKDFLKVQQSVQGTKGVDFAGILEQKTLVLFEVKNFRGHRIRNKPRMVGGDDPLWLEIAQKMRDAIAVVNGAARNSTHHKTCWQRCLDVIRNEGKSIHLILWLEQDLPPSSPLSGKNRDREELNFNRDLKKSLKWLTSKVDVVHSDINPFPHALQVSRF